MSAEALEHVETCPRWCRDDHDHPWPHTLAVGLIGGRTAGSSGYVVDRVLERGFTLDESGMRHFPSDRVTVRTTDDDADLRAPLLDCTPSEARSLAAALLRAADVIELS